MNGLVGLVVVDVAALEQRHDIRERQLRQRGSSLVRNRSPM